MRSCAFTLGGTKDALLYFDYVVPVTALVEEIYQDDSQEHNFIYEFIASIDEKEVIAHLVGARVLQYMEAMPQTLMDKDAKNLVIDLNRKMFELYWDRFKQKPPSIARSAFDRQLSELIFALRNLMQKSKSARNEVVTSFAKEIGINGSGGEPEVSLTNLKMVDTSYASMAQILELRKDSASRMKLLRLRNFIRNDFSGYSLDQIEDELSVALDDYEETAKKWDFRLKSSSISTLLDSREAMTGFVGSLLAVVAGMPIAAAVAGSAGMAFAIGKVGLNLTEKRFSMRQELGSTPVSYIVHARERFGN